MRDWMRAALVRAVKSAAQGAIAAMGTTAVLLTDVNWWAVLSAAVMMFVLSMLTSVAGIPEVDGGASVAKIAKGGGAE